MEALGGVLALVLVSFVSAWPFMSHTPDEQDARGIRFWLIVAIAAPLV